MRRVFAGLVTLLVPLVVLQFYLAAMGAFDTAPKDEAFGPHEALGFLIVLYALAMTLLAALARMPGRLIGMLGLMVVLGVLQPVIAGTATAFGDTTSSTTTGELVFGLHAVNGLAILGLTGAIVRRRAGRPVGGSPSRARAGGDVEGSGSTS